MGGLVVAESNRKGLLAIRVLPHGHSCYSLTTTEIHRRAFGVLVSLSTSGRMELLGVYRCCAHSTVYFSGGAGPFTQEVVGASIRTNRDTAACGVG